MTDPHPHLHHAVLSVLAAQGFSRSSSLALHAATDLLSRYLKLLARSCAQQAENAGRTGVSFFDVVAALEEMGTELPELLEWAEVEGRVDRQVVNETEALEEWDAHLQEGLYHDPDDAIPLVYAAPPTPDSDAGPATPSSSASGSRTPSPLPNTLPLSPISLSPPGSPPPKRARWDAPEHIPSFLPPLPGEPVQEASPEPPGTGMALDDFDDLFALPHELEEQKPSLPPPPPVSQPIASFHVPTPYATSSFAHLPRSHLPASPRRTPPPSPPGTNPLFISAMQILKTDAHGAASLPISGPAAHQLGSLVARLAATRYDPPDTLFGASDAPFARHAAPTPTHAVPLAPTPTLPVPPAQTRPLASRPPAHPAPPYLAPMFPTLAQTVLPLPVYNRVERLGPPPLLQNNEQFLYGRALPAPWNGHAHAPAGPTGEKEPRVEDASLRATWEVHPRDYRESLVQKKGRAMSLSMHGKREWNS